MAKHSVPVDSILRKDLKTVFSEHQEEIQDELTQLFWKEQAKAFKKQERGMRWHPTMIRLALLLHSRGPGAYNTLRDTGILKLPGESTLRDYTNYITPQTGFNLDVVEELRQQAEKLSDNERFVTLMHDEMSVKQDLVWDSKTVQLVGFVNLHQWQQRPDFNNIATHVLVFYVVGVNSSLNYSLGYFGSKSATSDQIYPPFWQAVGILEQTCKLKVTASTSDKASPNQRLYQIHGQPDHICNKTINFYAPDREIFFFSDVPHLIKTVRNNLFRSSPGKTMLLWNNRKELLWSHIRRVYNEDVELRRKQKLTYHHMNLTNHALMNVKLAAQVLSFSVGSVLQKPGYEECQETARLYLEINYFFDYLNTRSYDEAHEKRNANLAPYTDKETLVFRLWMTF